MYKYLIIILLYFPMSMTLQAQTGFQEYTVQFGDTLSAIAVLAYGDASQWQLIQQANADIIKDINVLEPGWTLRIPPVGWQSDAELQDRFQSMQTENTKILQEHDQLKTQIEASDTQVMQMRQQLKSLLNQLEQRNVEMQTLQQSLHNLHGPATSSITPTVHTSEDR